MIDQIELAGEWQFAFDPNDEWRNEGYHTAVFDDRISLPGTVDLAGKAPAGESAGMAHLTRRRPYVGAAWYARDFDIPAAHEGLFHELILERPHGKVSIWLDDLPVGNDLGLCTPNRFLLGQVKPGRHRLVMRIDNANLPLVGGAHMHAMPHVAHSTSDHTQTNWNGVVGDIRVNAFAARIARLDIFPDAAAIDVKVEMDGLDMDNAWPKFWNEPGHADELRLAVALSDGRVIEHNETPDIDSAFTRLDVRLTLPDDAARWDEFSPAIHHLTAEWWRDGVCLDRRETSFGLRSLEREGRHILVNGRRIFLRGTLDCCIFPKTGHPPTDRAGWRTVFEAVAEHGLNHVRFHSWCPPRAAFEVADDMGIYLHIETPVWCVIGGNPDLDAFIRREADRILAEYGNHPSFIMLTVGNELYGAGLHAFLERFMQDYHDRDPRHLYNGSSGWPSVKRAGYLSKPEPRSHRWGEGLKSRLNALPLETETDWSEWVESTPQPLIGHEIGQWCAFPDLATRELYDGPLANDAFDRVADDLANKRRLDQAEEKLLCSGALQVALYKEDIEASLRTPDYAGFQLLGIQDFPGQGTALVGVADAFWRPKPYDDPAAFRRFCGPVVPLLRARGFVLTKGEPFTARAELSCFAASDLDPGSAEWRVLDAEGRVVASGHISHGRLTTGGIHTLGQIVVQTTELAQARYILDLSAGGAGNSWDFWVFDTGAAALPLVSQLGKAELARLEAGETLVFAPAPDAIAPNAELGHTTVFWNTVWTDNQPPHTLGLINRLEHGVFRDFPADKHSGWHEWELTHRRRALDLQGLGFTRIIDVIDDWNANRDLALLAEARVGAGRLIVSAIDFASSGRPVASALARALASYLDEPDPDASVIEPESLVKWARTATIS